MKKQSIIVSIILILIVGLVIFCGVTHSEIKKLNKLPTGTWQSEVIFPDWKEYVDDTLAMNSMYSFDGAESQGTIYLTVDKRVKSYELFVNNKKVSTKRLKKGIYKLNIKDFTVNGKNTIQVTNIKPNIEKAVIVNIPYPKIIKGKLNDVGLSKEPFKLIDKIIKSDIKNGYTSAELAVIKDNKLVYQKAWGQTNSYTKDGKRIKKGKKITNDTLYDLASNTKMYSVAYSIQYLVDNEKIKLDDKVEDILGKEFVDDTIKIEFASFEGKYPGLDKIKDWKSKITVKDLLTHSAGFPDSGHYHNQKFDQINQKLDNNVDNILYVENANKEKTLKEGINKTPLMYEPGTNVAYSDIDYMLLGLIIEKVTNKDLDTFLKETYLKPMGLKNITYKPLENGFNKDDCAATELNGNTRDGLIDFPGIRKDTIKCEVHDEEAYYTMEKVSGHAGLFANATNLASLASVMLTGGYDNNRFFSKDTRDLFISPQKLDSTSYGLGWWRKADDKRVWYFGTESKENTIGHQGFTGTLTMIDFENNMVVVFLTNMINTPITDKTSLEGANTFNGKYYTTSTLGFVPQIIYTGLNKEIEPKSALKALIKDMAKEKQKLVLELEKEAGKKLNKNHPIKRAQKALEEIK